MTHPDFCRDFIPLERSRPYLHCGGKNQLTVCLLEADGRLEPLHRDELSSDEAEVKRDLIDFRVRDPNPGIFFDEDIFLQQRIARRSRQVQRRPLDGVEADRLLANV